MAFNVDHGQHQKLKKDKLSKANTASGDRAAGHLFPMPSLMLGYVHDAFFPLTFMSVSALIDS
jgi:hypothetical protein